MLCTYSPLSQSPISRYISEISELELSPASFCLSYIHILTGIPLSRNFLVGRSRKFFRLHALPHAEIHRKIHIRGIIPVPTVEIDLLDPLHTAGDIRILHKAELPVPRSIEKRLIHQDFLRITLRKLFSAVGIHPKFFSTRKFQNICPQDSILALAAMVEHHSIMVIHAYDQYQLISSFRFFSIWVLYTMFPFM